MLSVQTDVRGTFDTLQGLGHIRSITRRNKGAVRDLVLPVGESDAYLLWREQGPTTTPCPTGCVTTRVWFRVHAISSG